MSRQLAASFWASLKLFGIGQTIRIVLLRWRRAEGVHVTLHRWPHLRLRLRLGNSDFAVAQQVFLSGQYDFGPAIASALREKCEELLTRGMTPVVIDGGANAGFSSLYFAHLLPEAVVIAIEPGPDTFANLAHNTANAANVTSWQGALWSDDEGVSLHPGDQGSWSDQVGKGGDGNRVASMTLRQAADLIPASVPLIVKLDIEGSEGPVCDASRDMLRDAPCVIIESHDWMLPGQSCLGPLLSVMGERRVDVLVKGENLVFIDSELHARASTGVTLA